MVFSYRFEGNGFSIIVSNSRANIRRRIFTFQHIFCLLFLLSATNHYVSCNAETEISYVIEPFESISDEWFSRLYNEAGKLNMTLTDSTSDEILFGEKALLVEYEVEQTESWGGFVDFGWILNSTEPAHNCLGATHVSLWYKVLQKSSLKDRVHLRLIMLDDSECIGLDCDEPPGQNLENYYSFHYVLDDESTEWQELRIELRGDDNSDSPFWRTGWTGNVGNNQLDPNSMRGWRLELSIDSQEGIGSAGAGTILFDQLACEGGGDLFGAAFRTGESLEHLVDEGMWFPRYYQSALSENKTVAALREDSLILNYTIEQTESWGGFIDYQHLAPGNAYYNLSKSSEISLQYQVETAASIPGRAHLRIILMDDSDCSFDCNSYPGQNLENYYSFFYVLDEESSGIIAVELEGDSNSTSAFWRTGWTGIVGNNVLDRSSVKGFRLELNVDSQGIIGSTVSGAVMFSGLTSVSSDSNSSALVASNITSDQDSTARCVGEPGLTFLVTDGRSDFRRKEFLGSKCCETCEADPNCLYALATDEDCYMASYVHPDSVRLIDSETPNHVHTFWMDDIEKRGDFCERCDCKEVDLTIDCRGKDLTVLPKTFSPQNSSWEPRVLDLRDNSRLSVLGAGSLSSLSNFIEELRLPDTLRHLSYESINDLPFMTKITFEENDTIHLGNSFFSPESEFFPFLEMKNVISGASGFFSDVCCGKGSHVDFPWPHEGLTFCDMKLDAPGIDAVYEPFVEYFEAARIVSLRPSSSFMAEAAESPQKCAEYCAIRDGCSFFSYDARWKESEHTCALLLNNGTMQSEVCCDPDDYADVEGTLPGWTSGRVPSTRRVLDNARLFTEPQSLVMENENMFLTQYEVSLGSTPLRGAVWIEPEVASKTELDVFISPNRIVLYDDKETVTVTVGVLNAESIVDSETIIVSNIISSCDAAFMISDSLSDDNMILIDVKAPKGSFLIIGTVVPLIATAILTSGFIYISYKRRKADLVWNIDSAELKFDDPPEIIGRGTFGLVLMGEYRGTEVAVKRVIPPRIGKRQMQERFKMSLFGRGERQNIHTMSSSTLGTISSKDPIETIDLESGFASVDSMDGTKDKSHHNPGIKSGFIHSVWKSGSGSSNKGFNLTLLPKWRDEYVRLKRDFVSEMRILSKLRHPCITTVMGAVISNKEEPMLVMEFMKHGSLYDVIHNETMIIDGEHILPILRDIASGLRFLHAADPQVIHGDLKAQNILVDMKFRAKVADFGLTMKQQVGGTGTPYWMAPELLRGESRNTAQSDVYSMGVILYEIFSRKDPYEGEDFQQVLKLVADPTVNKRPEMPSSCPPEIRSLMTACVSENPAERPTFEDLDQRLKSMEVVNVEPSHKIFSMQAKKDRFELLRTSQLLFDVFPQHVAEALRDGKKIEPESRDIVTIFFSDIVGFTNISSSLTPIKVSDMLDRLYNRFDALSKKHDVFKVETIGDAYMAVTNLIKDQDDHAKRIAEFAIDAMNAANETLIDIDDAGLGYVNIRVGFHSGPVVANVVGSRNPRYCLFGDTVNTASRMESNSVQNRIHCSERSAKLLHEQCPTMNIHSRGLIPIKGKGEMHTYWVNEGLDLNSP